VQQQQQPSAAIDGSMKICVHAVGAAVYLVECRIPLLTSLDCKSCPAGPWPQLPVALASPLQVLKQQQQVLLALMNLQQ